MTVLLKNLKTIFAKTELPSQLAFISANFSIVADTILKLEWNNLALVDSIQLVTNCFQKLSNVQGKIGEKVF